MQKREFTEHKFTTSDNVELYYKHWQSEKETDKAIVLFHRGHEHSGRLQHIVDELNLPDINMFAWDARGHGMSPGKRGYSPSVDRSVADIEEFVNYISQSYKIPVENMIVVAQSIGAVYALAWVHDYAARIRGLIVASPAFDVKLYVPFARQLIAFGQKLIGQFYISSYVKAKFLTHDKERIDTYNSDNLITKQIATNILLELFDTSKRIVLDAGAIKTPLQLFVSGSDFVVHKEAIYQFYDNLGSPQKEKHIMDGFFHDTLGEKNRAPVMAEMRKFICQKYDEPLFEYDYKDEDKTGVSEQKRQTLQRPPKQLYKCIYYKFLSWMMKHFGILSDGMALGMKSGFDSGSSLDYVYQNKPCGKFFIGKLIDRAYLNSAGWKGVRERKKQLVDTICSVMQKHRYDGKKINIVDVASGYGRYIFEALKDNVSDVEKVLLRDFNLENVERGKKIIKEQNLENLVDFEQGDAFNQTSVAQINNNPNIAVISGLFELFSDNNLLHETLHGLSIVMEKGGYLIYTNQPWHPQQEIIARVLSSHQQGKPWVMRCRSQAEIDSLVEKNGFKKVSQMCSENAIFTVSIARKL